MSKFSGLITSPGVDLNLCYSVRLELEGQITFVGIPHVLYSLPLCSKKNEV
jgi:hypothetical protein